MGTESCAKSLKKEVDRLKKEVDRLQGKPPADKLVTCPICKLKISDKDFSKCYVCDTKACAHCVQDSSRVSLDIYQKPEPEGIGVEDHYAYLTAANYNTFYLCSLCAQEIRNSPEYKKLSTVHKSLEKQCEEIDKKIRKLEDEMSKIFLDTRSKADKDLRAIAMHLKKQNKAKSRKEN